MIGWDTWLPGGRAGQRYYYRVQPTRNGRRKVCVQESPQIHLGLPMSRKLKPVWVDMYIVIHGCGDILFGTRILTHDFFFALPNAARYGYSAIGVLRGAR